tara:strand:- start:443 stop:625 length:183 start_codon:yes stop_codon:yes gene_type:complete
MRFKIITKKNNTMEVKGIKKITLKTGVKIEIYNWFERSYKIRVSSPHLEKYELCKESIKK